MGEHPRKDRSPVGIGEKEHGHESDGKAHHSPGGFEDEENADCAEDQIPHDRQSRPHHEIMIFQDHVGPHHNAEDCQRDVHRFYAFFPAAQPGRIEKIDEDEGKSEMNGTLDLGFKDSKGCGIKLKKGESDADPPHKVLPECPEGSCG